MEENRKIFSRLGLGMLVMLVLDLGVSLLWEFMPQWILGPDNSLQDSPILTWIVSFVRLYVLAMPAFYLIVRKLPRSQPLPGKLGAKRVWTIIFIMMLAMYGGNLLGRLVAMLISGGTAVNPLDELLGQDNPLITFSAVVLAPITEELVFRKIIIDRTHMYGEKTAIVLSALLFGAFHLNFYQFFYAFGIGILFGYMYVRTGKIRNTILLHGIVNFFGGVIAPGLVKLMESDMFMHPENLSFYEQQWVLLLSVLIIAYALALVGASIAGIVLLIKNFKKAQWQEAPLQIPKKEVFRKVYWNAGIMIFLVSCLAYACISLYI